MHLLYCTSHVRTYIMHSTLYVYAFMYGIHMHWYMHIFGVPEYSYVCVHVCVHVFAPIHFRLACIHMYVCTYILHVLLHVHINVCSLTMSTYIHATGSISTYTHLISWNDTQLPTLIGYESVNYFVNSLY